MKKALVLAGIIILSLIIVGQSSAGIDPNTVVGVWLFDGDLIDSSGNGLDGVVDGQGNAEWGEGKFNESLSVLGQAWVVIPSVGKLKREAGSATLWIRPNAPVPGRRGTIGIGGYSFDGMGGHPDEKCYQMFCDNNMWYFRIGHDGGASVFTTVAGDQKIVTADEWNHFAMTWEEGVGTVYINGEEAGTIQGQVPTAWRQDQIFIGRSWNNEMFKGFIDDVAIFNVALAAGDVSAIIEDGAAALATSVSPVGNLASTWGKVRTQ